MLLETKISRRGFMKAAGSLTFAFSVAGGLTGRAAQVLAECVKRVRNVYFLEKFGAPEAIW